MDRANVIQFERVGLNNLPKKKDFAAKGLSYSQFDTFCKLNNLANPLTADMKKYTTDLRAISRILEITGLSIGFRILRGVNEYMHLAIQGEYFEYPQTAFDFQIKQRILPKIRGMRSPELKEGLEELKNYLKKEGYLLSLEKVAGRTLNGREYGGMLQQLETRGYVNYWEIR